MMKFTCLLTLVILFSACRNDRRMEKYLLSVSESAANHEIVFLNPPDGAVFPAEFPETSFLWTDRNSKNTMWFVYVYAGRKTDPYTATLTETAWKPEPGVWSEIKKNAAGDPVTISVVGANPKDYKTNYSVQNIRFSFSEDSVGAPIFYRAVPLPFSYATSHLDSIKYMLGDIASAGKPKVLLENLPVCGNCHSFSPDGKRMGMDVDAFGDKGSYLIADVSNEVVMNDESFISWSDFQQKSTMALLSQISPKGDFVVSTLDDNEIFEARDQLEYSQLFFPVRGILTTYDVENKSFHSLPGADDTLFVQSNPSWSPDQDYLYFARSVAVQRKQSGMTYGTGIYDLNKFQALRDSFLSAKKKFKFDVMKIPFNNGKGGTPEFVEGASENGKSNYFPKISPDGKWMVFCMAENYMLLQPDSKLYIMPTDGSAPPRLMNCNTDNMNSWHSWSPNGKWMVFSSKKLGPYTQLFLTHIDEKGMDSPAVWLDNLKVENRAANIPEFVNTRFDEFKHIADDFSDIADYNVRGTSKAQFGDFENAITDFNKALQVNPNDDQAYANRGKAKDELGDPEGAVNDLSRAIELNPGEHDYYIHRGNARVKMKKFSLAIDDCSKAISIKPDDAAIYAHRAGIYQLASKYAEAEEDFTRAIKLDSDYALYYVHRANIYNLLQQKDKAEKDIEKAVLLEPSNVSYITLNGIYAKNYGDLPKAVSLFNKAIKVNPSYYEAYAELALILNEQKKHQEAIGHFDNAIKFYDKSSKRELAYMYNNRGTVYGELGKFDQAVNDFTEAIQLVSNFADAYSNRAYARLNLNQLVEAEQDCQIALTIDPGMRKALMIKEMIQKKNNRF